MRSASKIFTRWQEGFTAVALIGAPAAVMLAVVPGQRNSSTAAAIGVVAGALLLMATFTSYLHWLAMPHRSHGWVVSAMVVMSSQMLVSSGLSLVEYGGGSRARYGIGSVDLAVTTVALALAILGSRGTRVSDPLLLGLVLGTALSVLQVAELSHPGWEQPSTLLGIVTLVTILGGYAWIADLMWRDRDLPGCARRRLALTVCLIGVAHIPRSGFLDNGAADVTTAVALAAAAALWTSATFGLLREAFDIEHRRSAGLEDSLLEVEAGSRGSQEQLHEIRSTVAGAACASRLLNDPEIGAATHARLERAISAELDRLERLVGVQPRTAPGPVDLDTTLDALLVSHEARGRTISWEPTGATVHARPDDVAEVLNILLDNAATHGGAVSSIAVTHAEDIVMISVSDEGPGVPPERRDQIFDWGNRGSGSAGQGIGLNLARRLMDEQGGSLTLDARSTPGSSFVIRLPATRHSEENHARGFDHTT